MSQGIFDQLNWLTNKVKKLCCIVEQLQKNSAALDSEGNLIGINNSSNLVEVGPGATHNIPNFSGMVIINDHYNGGVEMWLCGGGMNAVLVSRTDYGPGAGSMTINGGINGYTWTNTNNQVGPFTFTVIKTRAGA